MNNLYMMKLEPTEEQFNKIMQQVKTLGDKGNIISDTELYDIALKAMGREGKKPLILNEFIVTTGNTIVPTASVKMSRNGENFMEAAVGNGPVDATLNALVKAVNLEQEIVLEEYHVAAITGGTDAYVNVEIRLRSGDILVTSRGIHSDIVMASIDAYLKGVNLFHNMQQT